MKRLLTLTALMASFSSASAAVLADNLPAGALMTLQTNGAGPAFDRLLGVVGSVAKDQDMADMVDGLGGLFKGSIGNEATLGVFSVGTPRGGFTPALLAVTRADVASSGVFQALIPKKAGAKVGKYTFVRKDDLFVGMGGGLVYLSSDKGLLMSYLGRLGGNAAPRLNASAAYTVPSRAVGEQELSLYFNFSATAKVIRGQLGNVLLPRLLSPIVDALDTLGSYAAGFSTTDSGLTSQSAHVPNPAGKDTPLYAILTHTADFGVQTVIPASAEMVRASACAPESASYLGRWLTRIDLLDPTGFLTDSQLAAHLEKSSRYLGDECATVTLAGGGRAGFSPSGTGGLDYAVTYQSVSDRDAAMAQLPAYVASLNSAIQGLAQTLGTLSSSLNASGSKSQGGRAALQSGQAQIDMIRKQVAAIKVVYGFRGEYLVMANSERALAAALDEATPVLADDTDFQATDLNFAGVGGWSYSKAGPKITPADMAALLGRSTQLNSASERATLKSVIGPVSEVTANLINRYQGMSSQTTVAGGLILNKANVRYAWSQE
ncbi:hypothetical protein [Deinococcus altitudinis]|uniref:hypothetical protein n=1 Tax=Deinococcus altitudinis TaxID=468914 RepID=UPI0038922AB4